MTAQEAEAQTKHPDDVLALMDQCDSLRDRLAELEAERDDLQQSLDAEKIQRKRLVLELSDCRRRLDAAVFAANLAVGVLREKGLASWVVTQLEEAIASATSTEGHDHD